MGQLVDDDRLERLGWREDEPPAEHQAAVPRRAPPATGRVAQGNGSRRHAEARGVIPDRRVDREPGLLPQPALEDGTRSIAVASDEPEMELRAGRRDDPRHGRSPAAPGRSDPQPMDLARIADGRAVNEAAAGCQLGSLASLVREMTADPSGPLAEELVDQPFGMRPAAARRGRHADDQPEVRIDRDPEVAGTGRSAEGVLEPGAVQRRRARYERRPDTINGPVRRRGPARRGGPGSAVRAGLPRR